MKIIRADAMGMCFGVRDALALTEELEAPEGVTIHGELVHNEVVLGRLRERGFRMASEDDRDRLPDSEAVLITAHGISERERARLVEAGKRLVDTTCPLVERVHAAAQGLQDDGFHVIVIGQLGHVEVRGIVEDLESWEVVGGPDDVTPLPYDRLGVICQSTVPESEARVVFAAIERENPTAELRYVDTVCKPTKERQAALESLLPNIDTLVVVGGHNSNNTRKLVRRGTEAGLRTWHVQDAAELEASWFEGSERVGLTAGTSTLQETIDAVDRALRAIAAEKSSAR